MAHRTQENLLLDYWFIIKRQHRNSKVEQMHRARCVGRGTEHLYTFCREPFQAWEMWPSPHSEKPVGSEVWWAEPTPMDRFPPGGDQACIVPRLL